MSPPSHLQIAIDGPAASGKTTVAHRLADRLHILYLDTGAMYRTLAHLALQTRTDADNEGALVRLWDGAGVRIELDPNSPLGFRINAGGRDIDERILQSNEVTAIVSTIAAHPRVREALVRSQRDIAARGPVVMAGRDIGTVVLPFAQVKIFLTASVEARVARRRAQLLEAGVDISIHQLAQEIEERDRLDRERAASPLVPAPDAHAIDSSTIDADAVVAEIAEIVRNLQREGGGVIA
ncbi:MAG: (d)CMP kinase [Candidatus Eremiobacteraeota bacterium]|nr:(d)CMP kinase [Candidatus Eremiobacteraeota bacterium]